MPASEGVDIDSGSIGLESNLERIEPRRVETRRDTGPFVSEDFEYEPVEEVAKADGAISDVLSAHQL